MAAAELWKRWFHGGGLAGFSLPVALALTAGWQLYALKSNYPNASRWMLPTVAACSGVAVGFMLNLRWFARYRASRFGRNSPSLWAWLDYWSGR